MPTPDTNKEKTSSVERILQIVLGIGVLFLLVEAASWFYSSQISEPASARATQQSSYVIATQKSFYIQPTVTSVPRISSSDLSSICTQKSDLDIGYVTKERNTNINETLIEEQYKNGLEGFYEIIWDASDYPLISCQLFLYSTKTVASIDFQEMKKHPSGEEFALQDYGDERFGVVDSVFAPYFYHYIFRDGHVIVQFYIINKEPVEYDEIDKLVNHVNARLNQYDTK